MFPFDIIQKKYNELRNEVTVEQLPTGKHFNAVCSVFGGLFLCFWGVVILALIAPYLTAIPTMKGTELLYIVATFVVCGIIFFAGAVLILQSKTPPLMKRFFYGMLSLPIILFGLGLGWLTIRDIGFAPLMLTTSAALVVLGIHWARLAFKQTTVKDAVAKYRGAPKV